MKRIVAMLFLAAITMLSASALAAPPADTLAEVRRKGVLVAGVKDSLPPFGYIDAKTRTVVGYDIDFINAIAKKLGVRVELKPVTSASRIPLSPAWLLTGIFFRHTTAVCVPMTKVIRSVPLHRPVPLPDESGRAHPAVTAQAIHSRMMWNRSKRVF